MKKTSFLIFTLFAALLLLSSCITSRDINVEIKCDDFSVNNHVRNDFHAEIGDKIRVKLCSNPTTGFQWEYTMIDKSVLKEEDHDFEESEGDVPGKPSIEAWTFEAVEKGTTEVLMAYSQPWEGGEKQEWTYSITVVVE